MLRLLSNLRGLYKYRVLIQNLVSRELKARYRGTVLGFLWSFFNPLLLMIVYTLVFGFIIPARDPAFQGNPLIYAIFLFCGVLPWTWFSSSSIESANVLMVQEILPIVVVTSNFVHFVFGLPILFFFVLILIKKLTVYVFFLPLVILVQFVFSLGIALLVSSLTVHFRDIKDILSNLLTFWFFATPIIYPMTFITIRENRWLEMLLDLNPMTHIMQGYQNCVFYGEMIRWKRLGVTFLFALVLFILGYYIFDRLRDSFPEEV